MRKERAGGCVGADARVSVVWRPGFDSVSRWVRGHGSLGRKERGGGGRREVGREGARSWPLATIPRPFSNIYVVCTYLCIAYINGGGGGRKEDIRSSSACVSERERQYRERAEGKEGGREGDLSSRSRIFFPFSAAALHRATPLFSNLTCFPRPVPHLSHHLSNVSPHSLLPPTHPL